MLKTNPKDVVLESLFGRWRPTGTLADGYSVLLPTPMDMPFLLWFALEALRAMDTRHCNQFVVVPDGWGTDRGRTMERVVQSFDDPRILVLLCDRGRPLGHRLRFPFGSGHTHSVDSARIETCCSKLQNERSNQSNNINGVPANDVLLNNFSPTIG